MVNIVNIIQGGILNYGSSMESDQILQEWLNAHQRKLQHFLGDKSPKSSDRKYIQIKNSYLKDVEVPVIENTNDLETFISISESVRDQSHSNMMAISHRISETAKLLGTLHYQNLLALAASVTTGKPSRYCVQYDILPSITHWTHFAEKLDFSLLQKNLPTSTTLVIVSQTNQPFLEISRVICPLILNGMKVILVPEPGIALPCLILAEVINKAGLECFVYVANSEKVAETANVDIVVIGGFKEVHELRNSTTNLKLGFVGKKAIVAMDSGDCDGAVDSAITALKTGGPLIPGLYLLVQDSLLSEITWRLRDRLSRCRVGHFLDKMTDILDQPAFETPKGVAECINRTRLDVVQVGNARVVFNAQPSLPLCQYEQIGQTLLVISYRTVTELGTILANLTNISELSLWVEHQAVAWQIINQAQVQRIWVNGIGLYEPGFDQLIPIQKGISKIHPTQNPTTNSGLISLVDGLRGAQRTWAAQGKKNLHVAQFVKHLLESFSSVSETLFELLATANTSAKGHVVDGSAKNSMVFDLRDPVGLIAIIATDKSHLKSFVTAVVLALLHGNAIVLSTADSMTSNSDSIIKAAKLAGLSGLIVTCQTSEENHQALFKHHGIKLFFMMGDVSLPAVPQTDFKSVCELVGDESNQEIVDHVTRRKYVWMGIGDGLAV